MEHVTPYDAQRPVASHQCPLGASTIWHPLCVLTSEGCPAALVRLGLLVPWLAGGHVELLSGRLWWEARLGKPARVTETKHRGSDMCTTARHRRMGQGIRVSTYKYCRTRGRRRILLHPAMPRISSDGAGSIALVAAVNGPKLQ